MEFNWLSQEKIKDKKDKQQRWWILGFSFSGTNKKTSFTKQHS